jgi:1-acyl-sn-glycerol-3-phosphate acyltransferase
MPEPEAIQRSLLKFYGKAALFFIVTILLAPFYFLILFIFYQWRQNLGPGLVQFYSKICLAIFRVTIEQQGVSHISDKAKNILIISNHTSFLDIFVLSALFRSLFVSKAEVRYYPIIGQIAWLSGVIFFDRTASKERLRVLNTIASGCSGRILTIFPQGTTSSNQERLSFNRGIFKVVELNQDISLLPVTLHYREQRGIAWNRPQSLGENAIRVCSQKTIHVKVILHELITIDDYQGKTASQICKIAEQTVLTPLDDEH